MCKSFAMFSNVLAALKYVLMSTHIGIPIRSIYTAATTSLHYLWLLMYIPISFHSTPHYSYTEYLRVTPSVTQTPVLLPHWTKIVNCTLQYIAILDMMYWSMQFTDLL